MLHPLLEFWAHIYLFMIGKSPTWVPVKAKEFSSSALEIWKLIQKHIITQQKAQLKNEVLMIKVRHSLGQALCPRLGMANRITFWLDNVLSRVWMVYGGKHKTPSYLHPDTKQPKT